MNCDFVGTLKRVRPSRDSFPDAVTFLEQDLYSLQKTLDRIIPTDKNPFKNYAIAAWNQILAELKWIESYYEIYTAKDTSENIKTLTKHSREELMDDLSYYRDVLNIASEALGSLAEYLVTYWPGNYRDEGSKTILKTHGSRFSPIMKQFFSDCEYLEENGFNTTGKKTVKHIVILYWYASQDKPEFIITRDNAETISRRFDYGTKSTLYKNFIDAQRDIKNYVWQKLSSDEGDSKRNLNMLREIKKELVKFPKGLEICCSHILELEFHIKKNFT